MLQLFLLGTFLLEMIVHLSDLDDLLTPSALAKVRAISPILKLVCAEANCRKAKNKKNKLKRL